MLIDRECIIKIGQTMAIIGIVTFCVSIVKGCKIVCFICCGGCYRCIRDVDLMKQSSPFQQQQVPPITPHPPPLKFNSILFIFYLSLLKTHCHEEDSHI